MMQDGNRVRLGTAFPAAVLINSQHFIVYEYTYTVMFGPEGFDGISLARSMGRVQG
jgi:hypothetical protein